MKLIKLESSTFDKDIYVNPTHIATVRESGALTVITFLDGKFDVRVKESLEDVVKLINEEIA